jgi:hypothetical protein
MSEKLLKILIGELTTVRVSCTHCHTVVEVTVDALGDTFKDGHCLKCERPLFVSTQRPTPLSQLCDALRALQQQPVKTVNVEFSLKVD